MLALAEVAPKGKSKTIIMMPKTTKKDSLRKLMGAGGKVKMRDTTEMTPAAKVQQAATKNINFQDIFFSIPAVC